MLCTRTREFVSARVLMALRNLWRAAGRREAQTGRAAHASVPALGNDLLSYLRHPSRDQEVYLVRTRACSRLCVFRFRSICIAAPKGAAAMVPSVPECAEN